MHSLLNVELARLAHLQPQSRTDTRRPMSRRHTRRDDATGVLPAA